MKDKDYLILIEFLLMSMPRSEKEKLYCIFSGINATNKNTLSTRGEGNN